MRYAKWLLLTVPCLNAQPLGAGLKLGLPLSEAFEIKGESVAAEKPKFVLGPYVEVRLPARLAIEAGALREIVRFDYAGIETRASTWQFPVLVKYRFTSAAARPFLAGGVAAYRVGGIDAPGQLPADIKTVINRVGNTFTNGGGVVAGGVEFKVGPLRLAPEIRFTRWAIGKSVSANSVTLRTEQSRTQILVGIGL